jgi:MraZ protein
LFKGTYRHRIDPKGRLPVPAPFRRQLRSGAAASLVLTPLDQCLACYPLPEWERLEGQLQALPAFSRPVKALTRLLASRAVECPLDRQGRILLPPALRAAAALEREAVVVGVLARFELWPPPAWEAFLRESERLLEDVSLDLEGPRAPALRGTVLAGRPQEKPRR